MREVLGEPVWEKIRPRVARALAGEEVRYEDRLPYRGGAPGGSTEAIRRTGGRRARSRALSCW